MQTAQEIAVEYGAGDVALELAILRHMEHYVKVNVAAEREACAAFVDRCGEADVAAGIRECQHLPTNK